MESYTKTILRGVLSVVVGILFIISARLVAGQVSWGVGWTINAIGWLLIAAVIIPVCEEIKKSKGGSS